jgi:hypothetical protein
MVCDVACKKRFRNRSLGQMHNRIRIRSLELRRSRYRKLIRIRSLGRLADLSVRNRYRYRKRIRIRSLDLLHNHHRMLIHSRSLVRLTDLSVRILLPIHIRSLDLRCNQCHSMCCHIQRL